MEEITLEQIKCQLDVLTRMVSELKSTYEGEYLTFEEVIMVDQAREERERGMLVTQEEIDKERLINGLEV